MRLIFIAFLFLCSCVEYRGTLSEADIKIDQQGRIGLTFKHDGVETGITIGKNDKTFDLYLAMRDSSDTKIAVMEDYYMANITLHRGKPIRAQVVRVETDKAAVWIWSVTLLLVTIVVTLAVVYLEVIRDWQVKSANERHEKALDNLVDYEKANKKLRESITDLENQVDYLQSRLQQSKR